MKQLDIFSQMYQHYKITKTLNTVELFGGIGAVRKAMMNAGVKFNIVDYVEIDKYAVNSYNEIYNENFVPQDITKWNKDLKVDFIFHGSPCQDFSLAGLGKGGEIGSGTRSSLLWHTVRIVEKIKPEIVMWENVPNVLSVEHVKVFNKYLDKMEKMGYKNYYETLNAKHYTIPQNRNRLFVVSLLGNYSYEFPPKVKLQKRLKDLLESEVDEKYYLSEKQIEQIQSWNAQQDPIKNAKTKDDKLIQTITAKSNTTMNASMLLLKIPEDTKQGYALAENGDGVYIDRPHQKRGVVQKGMIQTIKTQNKDIGVVQNLRIRKLTPKECWRLMGFTDTDFDKASKVNSNAQLYKQAGNSIVVQVLEAIFKQML